MRQFGRFILPAAPPVVLLRSPLFSSLLLICSSPSVPCYFLTPSFHSVSFPLIFSTTPVLCFSFIPPLLFSSPFLYFPLPSSTIFKEAVTRIEESQRVFVCSCCFPVSAPLLFHPISRLQIHTVRNSREDL